ncbi:MAG: type I-E CRISPR-associated endoribonuclease Cas2e [Opitutae bacterium]
MVEIAPGVYTSPTMTRGVRERVWRVVGDWFRVLGGGSMVMTWRDPSAPGQQGVSILGAPPRTLVNADGVLLGKREK